MKSLPFLLLLFACNQTTIDTMPKLIGIKGNELFFADGSKQNIPHWGDSSYVTIFLVRHCEREKDSTTNPKLTAEGQARAERLGRLLSEFTLDSVYATPYKRAQQTAEPVQRHAKSASVLTYFPESQIDLLDQLLQKAGGKHIFIVGHQNTIPMALNYLKGDFVFQNIPDFAFDKFYIAITKGIGSTEVLEFQY